MDHPAYPKQSRGGVPTFATLVSQLRAAAAPATPPVRRVSRLVLALAAIVLASHAGAQGIGGLVSPGRLSKPHEKLEGLDKCESCHEPGRKVTAVKCLECHKPVAERIKAKKGVHRDVTGTECAGCHVEHAGLDGDLRHFEPKGFDHKREAGYALDGLHAPLDCKACHKARTYLGLSASSCASCHKDVHNGTLGATCQTCHTTSFAFKDTKKGYDHSKTKYPLTGAHAKLPCESCHKTKGEYRVARFSACEDCHKNPHQPALGTCTSCHVTASFKTLTAGQKFDHARTGYPLKGRHAAVACQTCHVKPATLVRLKYTRCADCHQDAHKGLFPREDCAACHTESGFKPAKFDHGTRTKFPLDGKHATTACAACHKAAVAQARVPLAQRSVDFRGAKAACASCHADVHKGKLGAACETCHGTSSFKLSVFQHPRQPEFFLGAHAGVACEKCHLADQAPAAGPAKGGGVSAASRQYRGVSFQCAACHKDPHLGQVGIDCAKCHGLATKGYKADLFVHTMSKFRLTGKHEAAPCAKCHAKETGAFPAGSGTAVRLTGISTECRACHRDPHFGQLSPRCETCHDAASFKVAKFVHPAKKENEGFFVGKHASIACAECHRKETFDYPAGRGSAVRYSVPVDCTHCHEDPHRGALGRDCASCHNATLWRTASRAFHKTGLFPLEGKHLSTPCASCHVKGVLKGTPTGCYDCHWIRKPDDRFKTKLGADCATCHRPIAWTAVTWSHAAATAFTLETPHKTLDCESCHKGQVFKGTPHDCYTCHRADYERVQNPNHVAGGFPTDCTGCHKPSAPTWQNATFVHSTFPLAGVHTTQACATCHVNNVFKGTPRECFSCHRTDYQNSRNPPHASAAFPTTCDSCHKFSSPNWLDAGFNHNVTTTFTLAGVHVTQPCTACHVNNVYKGTPRDCYSCHKTVYQNSKNPSHLAAGFATTCDSCHKYTDAAWKPSSFNHGTATTFALAGVHTTQACATCHVNNVFKGTPRDCYTCHKTDYQNSVNPGHTAAGFPTTCDTCHKFSDPAWKPASFNHGTATTFALAGVHTTQACATCHVNNVYKGTPRDCYSCHKTVFNASVNPPHLAGGFLTTCDTCHQFSAPAWKPSIFSHSTNTTFPLAGAHTTQACAACHTTTPYKTAQTTCVGCHQNDYNTAKTPVDHIASSFQTTCDSCHKFSDTTWLQATFSHTTFPLVGVHATTACTVCHNPPYAPSANNYTTVPTTCYGCHQRDVTGATTPVNHAGLPTTCDTCHKNTDATWLLASAFAHATYFPLAGAHVTAPCAQCHKNGNF
ncbi:MAG TPA: cytochrome c3 family protein, partial [Thermoanaerobaculia bacterium]